MNPGVEQVDPSTFAPDGPGTAAEVRRIAEACDEADGVITLNEQACLQLKYRGLRDASLSVPSLARSRRTCTSTVRVPPK